MPEINYPGVYVQETSSNPEPIRGVNTSTAAFVGLTVQGPAGSVSGPLPNFKDYVAAHGGAATLQLSSMTVPNYMALAAWAFFENGGQQLYVSRVAAADGAKNFVPAAVDLPGRGGGD